jgi:hypothetical protein
VKDLNELQAMNRYLLKHTALFLLLPLCSTEMKDRTHDQELDMLSTYDQDDLNQSVFVAREMPVELEDSIEYQDPCGFRHITNNA